MFHSYCEMCKEQDATLPGNICIICHDEIIRSIEREKIAKIVEPVDDVLASVIRNMKSKESVK